MKIKVDKAGNPRYLTVRLGWGEQFDAREMEALCSGALPMLIPPAAAQGNKGDALFFDVTPYAPLDFYLTYSFSRQQAGALFLSFVHALQRVQQGYMNYKNLLLELDKINVYLEDGSIHLIYLPLMNSTRDVQLPEFFYRLAGGMARSSYDLSAFLDECVAFLQRPAPFTLEEFEVFLQQRMYQAGAAAAPAQQQAGYGDPYASQPGGGQQQAGYGDPYASQPGGGQQQSWAGGGPSGWSAAPDASGGAPLPGAAGYAPTIRFYLLRDRTGERAEIAASFLVGTELGTVSYCVTGNPAVSRRHALFAVQDGRCYITDQGSTNSTYVNGCRLDPHTQYVLEGGEKLCLANEPFTLIREES